METDPRSSENLEKANLPQEKRLLISRGTTLLQSLRTTCLDFEAPCGGRGLCGKCRVEARGALSEPDQKETEHLGALLDRSIRLACRAMVLGPVEITLPKSAAAPTFQPLHTRQAFELPLDPPIRRIPLGGVDLFRDDGSLWDRLQGAGAPSIEIMPEILRRLAQEAGRGHPSYMEAVVKGPRLLALRYDRLEKCLGLALDIGTTSLIAELIDLESGETLAAGSCLNPQTALGADVITRVSQNGSHGTERLQAEVVKGINGMIGRLCARCGARPAEVFEVAAAGNTIMLHMLLGVDSSLLARAPYQPVFTCRIEASSRSVGIDIAPGGLVNLLPSVSAFVGSDITAGILATGFARLKEPSLFIDLGTNGEIVALKDGRLSATSSAAGPALEGMNIACGCRAKEGAVEAVAISPEGEVDLKVIGNTAPKGICGSGLIDLIAGLLQVGILEPSGRMASGENVCNLLADRLVAVQGRKAFNVCAEAGIFLTEKDVRQVQLAKGAIATAIELLLKDLGLSCADIGRVLVAGAFGAHLNPASLGAIGLLPMELAGKITFAGQTAMEGARAVLLDKGAALEMEELCRRIEIKELSLRPDFQDCFIKNLGFPEKRS